MPRVVPSQVVRYIDFAFDWANTTTGKAGKLDYTQSGRVSAIVALADAIPEHLLVLQDNEYADYVAQLAILRSRIPMWEHHGASFPQRRGDPVRTIRALLAKCPDQHPGPSVHDLTFVSNPELRSDLRVDIAAIERGLVEGDWKSVTVLAGAVVEALLLDRLSSLPPADVQAVEAQLQKAGTLKGKGAPLEKWDLHAFTEVAAACPVPRPSIKADTATQVRLAKDFRNLIHPGRSIRLATRCDRGTALAATAALEMVVRDLQP
jgi:hypothetical protein